jgi:two-component system chemotaxis response regulator CheY
MLQGVNRMEESSWTFVEPYVLVIDDLISARLILVDMLKELGFRRCLQARDGREALEVMQRVPVQLVLCDFMMDGMNGLDFLKELRARSDRNTPPVIFVSSVGDVQSVEHALTLGASDYLVKPVNFRKLRLKIERALSSVQEVREVQHA